MAKVEPFDITVLSDLACSTPFCSFTWCTSTACH